MQYLPSSFSKSKGLGLSKARKLVFQVVNIDAIGRNPPCGPTYRNNCVHVQFLSMRNCFPPVMKLDKGHPEVLSITCYCMTIEPSHEYYISLLVPTPYKPLL